MAEKRRTGQLLGRRKFIRLGAATIGAGLLGTGAAWPVTAEARGIRTSQITANTKKEQVRAVMPDMAPYQVARLQLAADNGELKDIAVRRLVPGIRLSEGSQPALKWIDEDHIARYNGSDAEQILADNPDILELDLLTAQELQTLLGEAPNPANGKIRKVLLAGDSWYAWNGLTASIGRILQDMANLEAVPLDVGCISASDHTAGHQLANLEDMERSGVEAPDILVTEFHPTDLNDTIFLQQPYDVQAAAFESGVRGVGSVDSYVMAAKRSGIRLLRRAEETFQPLERLLGKLRSVFQGKNPHYFKEGEKLTYLSPFAALGEGKPIYQQWQQHMIDTQNHAPTSILVGMPLLPQATVGDRTIYNDEVWPDIEATATQASGPLGNEANARQAITTHQEFDTKNFDADDHPTPAGCVFLAEKIFQAITHREINSDTRRQVNANIQTRQKIMDKFFDKLSKLSQAA